MKYHPCPGSAPGPFYVVAGGCHPYGCNGDPMWRAPGVMEQQRLTGLGFHCRFVQQPASEAELQNAIDVVVNCELCSVRYAGNDKTILDRINRPESCDAMPR